MLHIGNAKTALPCTLPPEVQAKLEKAATHPQIKELYVGVLDNDCYEIGFVATNGECPENMIKITKMLIEFANPLKLMDYLLKEESAVEESNTH
jgi:hypothetical protein